MFPNKVSMLYLYTYYEIPIMIKLFEDCFQLFDRTAIAIFSNSNIVNWFIVKALGPFFLIS